MVRATFGHCNVQKEGDIFQNDFSKLQTLYKSVYFEFVLGGRQFVLSRAWDLIKSRGEGGGEKNHPVGPGSWLLAPDYWLLALGCHIRTLQRSVLASVSSPH